MAKIGFAITSSFCTVSKIIEQMINLKDLGYEKIPENKYLVLGDNRSISKDSRIIGLIDKEDIEGYTGIIVFPFKRIGNVIE